jgi:hypothetical protein
MKTGERNTGWRNREFRIGSALLFLYGMVLAGSDPGWAMWAGAMAAGVLVTEIPPPMHLMPSELFVGAGTLAALGLSAFAALPFVLGGKHASPAGGSAGAHPPVRPFTETGGANR